MPSQAQDISGRRFGRLTVIERGENEPRDSRGKARPRWICQCECGNRKLVAARHLKSGKTISCGCYRSKATVARGKARATHGHTRDRQPTAEYRTWRGLIARAHYGYKKDARRYKDRGISVDPRWLTFENFLADMGSRPSPEHSLDRIDNDGPYSPDNCRWATRKEQMRNRSVKRLITAFGRTQMLAEWAEETGLLNITICARLRAGWSPEEAVSTPVDASKRSKR